MSVHYKFKSSLDYDTVTFDGLHISVGDLKKAIIQQKRIGKNTDFDLQVTNAQTKEVYQDENALIPKNTSLIIARVPLAAQSNKGRAWNETSASGFPQRGNEDSNTPAINKAVDLSRLDASEEDKIRAMMTQSTLDYDPSKFKNNYMKIRGANQMGEVPANYRCYKCHQPGHWIKNCPLGLSQEPVEIKKSTGIPRSFMVPVEGPMVPGAMMTPTGQYAVPALDHQAYNSDGGGRGGAETEQQRPDIPEDLVCSICKDLLTDAVMIPCCGNSFCDECIRTTLLESEDHECPDCHEKDISPCTLIPNRFLRNSVSNFRNETGYRKRVQYRHVIQAKTQVESTTEEKQQKIELPDFVPPPDDSNGTAQKLQQDQKPIISEADSTEQSLKQKSLMGNDHATRVKSREKDDVARVAVDPTKAVKTDVTAKIHRAEAPSYPQVTVNMMTGEVQPKVTSSQPVQELKQTDLSRSQYRPPVAATTAGHAQPTAPLQQPTFAQNEERSGTPTIDEQPGVSVPPPTAPATTHAIPAYPPGDTPPFMSPPEQNLVPGGQPPPGVAPNVRPPMLPPPQHSTYPPPGGYPPQQGPPPYSQPYPGPPNVRRPPPPAGPDFNNHTRGYLPRMPYDQVRPPPHGPYDGSRQPPPHYQSGYPPRPGGPPIGPRPPYGPPHVRNPPPGIRPPHHPTGVIDDPLAAFERMLREKDERDRRVRESRRSRSRSYSPRSRRTRSSSRSRSYSPRSRSPRSRSPPPPKKLRNRSRTPRTVSRSRSRSRGGPVLRRSRTPRSRARSFSISRSRSFSRTPSPREYSPRRRPVSRGRYRSPPPKNTPPRYRYPDRRGMPNDRDRGFNPPPRDREYTGYYDSGQPPMDYLDRGDRARINDRDKDYDREPRGGPIDHRGDGRNRRGGMGPGRGGPRGGGRYLPSPMRKEYPLVPQNQPTYYSVQEHAVYHHSNNPPNRLPPPASGGVGGGPTPPQSSRMGGGPGPSYPPALMSVKTAILPPRVDNYEPPAPPGTEEPVVPGFESPRLLYERQTSISDAPPGVDPHASDTVLTKPIIDPKERGGNIHRDFREPRDDTQHEPKNNRMYDYRERRKGTEYLRENSPDAVRDGSSIREKHSKSPDKHSQHHRHRHRYDSQEKDNRDRRTIEEKSSDKKNKDNSSEDDKAKSKSREKKKKRKEKEKEREAEKLKKKEEKKKRKEQEKLEKLKKSEEKKQQRLEHENAERNVERSVEKSEPKSEDNEENKKSLVDYKKQPDDLYSDVLTDGIDTKVVQNYGKLKTESDKKVSLSPPRQPSTPTPTKAEKSDETDEKDTSFDGLDLYVNESDILKTENEGKSKSKEVLAPLPALSKWEVEDVESQNDKKDVVDDSTSVPGSIDKNTFDKSSNKIVTSEVLKHAENAIFKKAINAIRPIEIKKISLDRAKLYSGEKNLEIAGGQIMTSSSPTRSIEKESITPANIQVTIPTNDVEMRLVDINPNSSSASGTGGTSSEQQRSNRSEREIPSAVQKPIPTRLSVRERLGSKVDELDKLTKDDKHYDRNRSRTLSPLSRRERDETNRNVSDTNTTRRVVEVEDRRHGSSRNHNWNVGRSDRKISSRMERSRSRERNYRDNRGRSDTRRMQQYRRGDDSRRGDERDRREHRDHEHSHSHSRNMKKPEKRVESSSSRRDKSKEKERKSSKYSRSRSGSRERKSSEKSRSKKKDKKHKKDKEKSRKHGKKDDDSDNRKHNDNDEEKEKKTTSETKETNQGEKKITERRKPTLDEANFEPDYDALESDSDSDNEKNKSDKKRDRSRSPDNETSKKKRKIDDVSKKSKNKEVFTSSSDSSSDSSSSEDEKPKKRHKKHKKHSKSKRASSSSSSNSGSESSSDEDGKKRRNKSKKHKSSKKLLKKKKKSKHR
ncbi:E3 ubiquitin-protein ligase RBBP6 isoform X3 [Chrysoperla carnea]|uniref:E3 ubiquitin-protein ligase RBBP6 isoform X3 n=1 Tax=Chrysoperla carnea TaxID=189513 RepID=UPI001D094B29|nr:E3 ubiquitin-protein ligase RBBP6 isoform X3 [Chrysoperla carnea]